MRKMNKVLCGGMVVALGAAAGLAQPTGTPVYTRTVVDAVSGGNDFVFGGFRYYSITPGADNYGIELYERPTASTYQFIGTTYAAEEYHGYVDIEQGRFGFDDRYVYAAIDLFSLDLRTKDGVNEIVGLQAAYGVRFGTDPDGRNSVLLRATQPQSGGLPPNLLFSELRATAYRDTDMDVGGRGGPVHGNNGPSGINVTKTMNILEEQGMNGYDQQFVTSDGQLESGGQTVLWQRISPTDPTVVEIAFDYVVAGYTRADLEAIRYLQFEAIQGGPSDPVAGTFNDRYTAIEAGSPNPGIGTDNEFGTQGLGSINTMDTVRIFDTPSVCAGDFNADGVLNPDDLGDYINCYFSLPPCPRADFNLDGTANPDDLGDFINAYFAGCP